MPYTLPGVIATIARLQRVALHQNQRTEGDVDKGNHRGGVTSSPRHDAGMKGQSLGAEEKDGFQPGEDRADNEPVGEAVGSQQGDPHRQIVATEREGDGEGGDASSSVLLARRVAVAPRVNRKGERRDAE